MFLNKVRQWGLWKILLILSSKGTMAFDDIESLPFTMIWVFTKLHWLGFYLWQLQRIAWATLQLLNNVDYIRQKHIPCETKQNKQKSLASNQSAPLTKWTSTMIHLWHCVFIEFGGNHYLWLCARDLFIGLMSWISQTMRIQVSSLNRSFEKAIETGTYLSEHSTIAYGEGTLNHSTLQVFTPLAYIQMRVHK